MVTMVTLSLVCMISSSPTARAGESEAKQIPYMIFVLTDSVTPADTALSQCERLTIQGYRERGVKVTELSRPEMDRWLEGEGKEHAKAHKYFQYIALAKSRGADAIGGLTSEEVAPDDPLNQAGVEAGTYFYSWGLSLSGVSHNFTHRLEGKGDVRAIPMDLVWQGRGADEQEYKRSVAAGLEEGDPWSIPLKIEPKPCVSLDRTLAREASPNRGRPFVGVGLKGNVLSSVFPGSPAEAAGLRAGDTLLSFNGHSVAQLADLQKALQGRTGGRKWSWSMSTTGPR